MTASTLSISSTLLLRTFPTSAANRKVYFMGKADMTTTAYHIASCPNSDLIESAFEGEADIKPKVRRCPLMTQSRHSGRPCNLLLAA